MCRKEAIEAAALAKIVLEETEDKACLSSRNMQVFVAKSQLTNLCNKKEFLNKL
jgi:hypothetical protein